MSSDLMSSTESESISGQIGRGLQVSPGINFSSNCLIFNGEVSAASLIGQNGNSITFVFLQIFEVRRNIVDDTKKESFLELFFGFFSYVKLEENT